MDIIYKSINELAVIYMAKKEIESLQKNEIKNINKIAERYVAIRKFYNGLQNKEVDKKIQVLNQHYASFVNGYLTSAIGVLSDTNKKMMFFVDFEKEVNKTNNLLMIYIFESITKKGVKQSELQVKCNKSIKTIGRYKKKLDQMLIDFQKNY